MPNTVAEIRKAMKGLTPAADSSYGRVWFNTETGELRYSLSDGDEQERYDEYDAAFKKIKGVKKIEGDAEIGVPKEPNWVEVGRVSRESFAAAVAVIYEGLDFAFRGTVPAEPGTVSIPSNHVRLYHYTRVDESTDAAKNQAAERLRRRGIDIAKARGSTYGEPNQVWASTLIPSEKKVFAEFSVSIDDPRIAIGRNSGMTAQQYMARGWDMTFFQSIKPKELIAVHEPWHFRYRYLMDNPKLVQQVVGGEFDNLLTTAEYGPAVARVKREHGIRESLCEDRQSLSDIIAVQTSNGNWNYDAYMHGLANGMILGKHVAFDEAGEPPFLDAPDQWLADKPFESMVERSYSHSAISKRTGQRRAAPRKQVQGRIASKDFKKAGGQRHGQRQRSLRIGRVAEREIPLGAKTRDELPKQPPAKLWHVTLFAPRILSGGFKTRNMLRGVSVLGGGSDDSVSFTEDRGFAQTYADGLRISIESLAPGFDPFNHGPWQELVKKYGFPHQPMINSVNRVVPQAMRRDWDEAKTTFEVLQAYSFDTRKFPLFMGGSWPDSILKAKLSDVAVLEISSAGPELWDYKPGEKEFRIFDVENIGRPKKVG